MPSFWVHTFGCQMNVHDSERMESVLQARGFTPAADLESSDLVVFNTCSVRERAEQKLRSEVGKLKPLKRARPGLVEGMREHMPSHGRVRAKERG